MFSSSFSHTLNPQPLMGKFLYWISMSKIIFRALLETTFEKSLKKIKLYNRREKFNIFSHVLQFVWFSFIVVPFFCSFLCVQQPEFCAFHVWNNEALMVFFDADIFGRINKGSKQTSLKWGKKSYAVENSDYEFCKLARLLEKLWAFWWLCCLIFRLSCKLLMISF